MIKLISLVALLFGISEAQWLDFQGSQAVQRSMMPPPPPQPFYEQQILPAAPAHPVPKRESEASPLKDYTAIVQIAKSLNKCPKCGKLSSNCTCGQINSEDIINKLINALVFTVMQNKNSQSANAIPTRASKKTKVIESSDEEV